MAIVSNKKPVAASSLPGGMTKDPRLLPVYEVDGAGTGLSLYDGGIAYGAGVAGFWTELALMGAQATGSTSDTYKEVCNITGSGILFHVVAQSAANTTDDTTFRITVDGTEYVIAKTQTLTTAASQSNRLCMGACVDASKTALYTTAAVWLQTFSGSAASTDVFKLGSGQIYMVPPSHIINNGMPCLRFDESLVVEVKVTNVYGTGTYPAYCGATYILD